MGEVQTEKVKWGCSACRKRGEIEIIEWRQVQYNVPAAHRAVSPNCPIERPPVGDEAWENAFPRARRKTKR